MTPLYAAAASLMIASITGTSSSVQRLIIGLFPANSTVPAPETMTSAPEAVKGGTSAVKIALACDDCGYVDLFHFSGANHRHCGSPNFASTTTLSDRLVPERSRKLAPCNNRPYWPVRFVVAAAEYRPLQVNASASI